MSEVKFDQISAWTIRPLRETFVPHGYLIFGPGGLKDNDSVVLKSDYESLHSQLEECRKEIANLNECCVKLEAKYMAADERAIEANEKLSLIRKDEGMQNRMLELFETRRESDERLKIAVNALEKIDTQDRSRGYPTGVEWVRLVTLVRETLAKIKADK